MESADRDIFDRMMAALNASPRRCVPSESVDAVSAHILQTLEVAVSLFTSGFHPPATFFAITALEELAKLRFFMFGTGEVSTSRRNNPAFSHLEKQALGAGMFPVSLRSRLVEICGETETAELLETVRTGGLIRLREQCLYFEVSDGNPQLPEEMVDKDLARKVLLLALDEYDDEVSGWTTKSFSQGDRATELFNLVADAV